MLQQFSNLSSWREIKVKVLAGKVESIDFDNYPNMFFILNPNDVRLRVAISKYPTVNSYEFTIDPNTSVTLGRPTPTGKLYVLNDGGNDADITIFSINGEFDMNILKNMSFKAEGVNLEIDGIIRGWQDGVMLPSGDNVIGEVILPITYMERTETMLSTLQAISGNTQKISTTNTQLQNIYAQTNNTAIELVKANNWLKEIANGIADPTTVTPVYQNNVVSFSYTATADCKLQFVWLMYDGGTTANVMIDDNAVLTVMAGEQFSNMEFELKSGQTLKIESTEPMYRLKYFTY